MQEQRAHFRKPIRVDLEFTDASGRRSSGTSRDISLGGAHVETPEAAAFGSTITVFLLGVKGIDAAKGLPAVVRWVKPGEMGIQFGLMGARETYAISQLISAA